MADPGFVHLHVHSSYSLLQGALPIARLAELATADRQPALALTDTDNMFGEQLYIELQRHGDDRPAEAALLEMAYARGIPIVATNEPFFAKREDHEAHDALICIAEGKLVADSERPQLSPEYRFKTRAEMATLFADLPEALASTVEIARRCAFRPMTQAPILPRFSVGERGEAANEGAELCRQAEDGLARRPRAHGHVSGRYVDDRRERYAI